MAGKPWLAGGGGTLEEEGVTPTLKGGWVLCMHGSMSGWAATEQQGTRRPGWPALSKQKGADMAEGKI